MPRRASQDARPPAHDSILDQNESCCRPKSPNATRSADVPHSPPRSRLLCAKRFSGNLMGIKLSVPTNIRKYRSRVLIEQLAVAQNVIGVVIASSQTASQPERRAVQSRRAQLSDCRISRQPMPRKRSSTRRPRPGGQPADFSTRHGFDVLPRPGSAVVWSKSPAPACRRG